MPRKKKQSRQRESIWGKIWKSLVALSVFAGLFSTTGIKLGWIWLLIAIPAVIVLAAYWHFVEWIMEFIEKVDRIEKAEREISGIKKDIKFIKEMLSKRGRK